MRCTVSKIPCLLAIFLKLPVVSAGLSHGVRGVHGVPFILPVLLEEVFRACDGLEAFKAVEQLVITHGYSEELLLSRGCVQAHRTLPGRQLEGPSHRAGYGLDHFQITEGSLCGCFLLGIVITAIHCQVRLRGGGLVVHGGPHHADVLAVELLLPLELPVAHRKAPMCGTGPPLALHGWAGASHQI